MFGDPVFEHKKKTLVFEILRLGWYLFVNPYQRAYNVEHLNVVSFNPQEQNYFSRSPVSSDAEAIQVKETDYTKAKAYKSALVASGFTGNNNTFTPCPLGTFTNLSTKGADGCQNCTPGKF